MGGCGDCRFFRVHTQTPAGGWLGDCRHQPQRGDFGPTAPTCNRFLSTAAPIPTALPEVPARRRAKTLRGRIEPLLRRSSPGPSGDTALPLGRTASAAGPHTFLDLGALTDMTRDELKALLREAIEEPAGDEVLLAPKWEGGSVVLKPRDPSLQPRELPIDQLLHKVVMVRDRLRVLEQKISAHPKLSDAEKVDMQQYVTRCYGSLTTFNQLFHDRADHFVGDKGGGGD